MLRYIVCALLIGRFGLLVESAEDPGAELCLGCPEYWTRVGEVCYRYFGAQVSWDDANTMCKQSGSNLPSIHSSAESDTLYQLWKTLVPDTTVHKEGYWIGANDLMEEGVYMWTDGTPFDYENWCPGEPNNVKSTDPSGEHCVTAYNFGSTDYERQQWNDYPCGAYFYRPFFCRKSL